VNSTSDRLLITLNEAARRLGMGRGAALTFCTHHGCLVEDGAGGTRVSTRLLEEACSTAAQRERKVAAMPRANLGSPDVW
jgi:hypothetical protein